MDYPIRPVCGNWTRFIHPLEKVVWQDSQKTIVDYVPQEGDKLTVTLQGAYKPYTMENVTIEGNVLKYENNGTLPCGLYDIVINVVLADGKRLRSHQDGIVKVVKTNKEASIPDYVEFGVDTYELDGEVFMYVPTGEGGSLEQVQADWEQDDSTAVDFIKNKPTIPSNTSELTNDSGFLTSETDPTVPSWAKQPNKPTYNASEVGALPANTPIPSEVTEQTVSGWGFTKNTGTYSKPQGGIPKTDLASDVQTSLGKADNAIQKSSSSTGLLKPNGDVDNNTYLTQHQQVDWNAQSGQAGYISNKPSIPTVPTISTDVSADASSDTKTASPAAVKTYVDNGLSSKQDTIDASHKLNADLVDDISSTNKFGEVNQIEDITVNGGSPLTKNNKTVDIKTPYPLVEDTTSTSINATIEPNKFYVWKVPLTGNSTITLGTEVSGVMNEYLIQFSVASGSTPQISFSANNIQWAGIDTFQGGKTYQVSIVNGYAIGVEFDTITSNS